MSNFKLPIQGFSKLSKEEKIRQITAQLPNGEELTKEIASYQHPQKQALFDQFSENTISNFYIPFGIAPNFLINDTLYHIPMAIEESSVVAAASKSAKFWLKRGGFQTRILSTLKSGQVHLSWNISIEKAAKIWPQLEKKLRHETRELTLNMEKRGGGIRDIRLVDDFSVFQGYYQIDVDFETADSMGANFINSCLEKMATTFSEYVVASSTLSVEEKEHEVIMSILSNYTPECLVECVVECPVREFDAIEKDMSGEAFLNKFERAIAIAENNVQRAVTHNKGIFNGIDAVVLATGNDFRAVEACGHSWASRSGKYASLTHVEISNLLFRYTLQIPMALGSVGGLTKAHPIAKAALEILGSPSASQLMEIAASAGMANNFGAVRALITSGIQKGHMKMHLGNILLQLEVNENEKAEATEFFSDKPVSYRAVSDFIEKLRTQ